jgi:hypothetical protein
VATYEQSFAGGPSGRGLIRDRAAPTAAPVAANSNPYAGMPDWVTDDYIADAYRRGWVLQNGGWTTPRRVIEARQGEYDALKAAAAQAEQAARQTGDPAVLAAVQQANQDRWNSASQAQPFYENVAQGDRPLTESQRRRALMKALDYLGSGTPQLGDQYWDTPNGLLFNRMRGAQNVGMDAGYREFTNNLATARQHFGLWGANDDVPDIARYPGTKNREWTLADLDALEKQARDIYESDEGKSLREFAKLPEDRRKHFGSYKNLLSHNKALTAAKNLGSQPKPMSPQGIVAGRAASTGFANLPTATPAAPPPEPDPLEFPILGPQTPR